MNLSEIGAKQTEAFIRLNPSLVLVRRRSESDDGAGGWTRGTLASATEFGPHVGRRIPANTVRNAGEILSSDGEVIVPKFGIVFMPETDIRKNDVLQIDDESYRIVSVSKHPEWRLTTQVVEYRGP